MKLVDLYKSILLAAGLTSDDEGYVYVNNKLFTGEENAPAMIEDQRIVLPTDDHLRHPSKDKIIFHPLREQALRGESIVFTKLRTSMTTRLNFTFAVLIGAMLDIAKQVDKHKTLSPEQAQLLSVGKNITDNTHIVFSEICMRTMSDPSMAFITMFMKKSGVVDGQSYRRVGVVSFPIYEELCKEQDKYFGMTIKPVERENIKAIMKYLLPNIDTAGKYNKGSNSDVAPYMDALMMVFGGIAGNFNDKIELYADFIPESKILTINSDWVDVFEDLDSYRTQIQLVPQQVGNEGASPVQSPNQPVLHPVPQAPTPASVVQPVPQPAPTYHTTGMLTHQPVQQPAQPAQPANTGKPRSFNEILESSPHLQQYRSTTVYPGVGGMQPMPASPGAPRGQWFAPQPPMGQQMPYGYPAPGQVPYGQMPYGQMPYGQPMMQPAGMQPGYPNRGIV